MGQTPGTSRLALGRLRRALDDWIELAQAVRTAALLGQAPPAETVNDWLQRVSANTDAVSDAIVRLWRASAQGAPAAPHPRSEQLVERLIQTRIDTFKAHLLAASSAEADTAVQRARRRRAKRLSPDAHRRLRTITAASPAFFTLVLPGIVGAVPSVTRRDMLWWIEHALPGSRGGRGGPWTPRFDDGALLAIEAALRAEHPGWGRRAAVEVIANRLVVDPRTIRAALRRAERARKNS